jgi:peptidoglycan hydrolase CwlO-like protein
LRSYFRLVKFKSINQELRSFNIKLLDVSKKGEIMSKYLVLAAALVVLAIACNKKEEAPATEATTTEQAAPAEAAPEAAPTEAAPAEAAPAEAAPATEAAPAQ